MRVVRESEADEMRYNWVSVSESIVGVRASEQPCAMGERVCNQANIVGM